MTSTRRLRRERPRSISAPARPTCATAPGIYRNRFTTSTPVGAGSGGSLRGFSQSARDPAWQAGADVTFVESIESDRGVDPVPVVRIYRGVKKIQERIESFGFQKIVYQLDHQDVQEGPINGSFIIFVTGSLCMDDSDQFKFSQVFNICPNGSGGLYCHNDIFTIVM